MVEQRPDLVTSIEDATVVEEPLVSGHSHSHRALQKRCHQRLRIVPGKLDVTPDSGHPAAVLVRAISAGRAQALLRLARDAAHVRVVPLGVDACLDRVVEGKLGRGTQTATAASALLGVRCAGIQLLRRKVEENASLECNVALQGGRGCKGPTTPAGTLVLHRSGHARAVVSPVKTPGRRQVGPQQGPLCQSASGDMGFAQCLAVAKSRGNLRCRGSSQLIDPSCPKAAILGVVFGDRCQTLHKERSPRGQFRLGVLEPEPGEVGLEVQNARAGRDRARHCK
mmetsp:Transcript_51638/g.142972  ORF Transcript_51638/g.142972 Transcript_51638/m.142972 type:complete len:282 (-) Transcript_51638:118-963(-)